MAIVDGHLHLPWGDRTSARRAACVRGCIISRSTEENGKYLRFAAFTGTPCAIFIGSRLEERKQAMDYIERKLAAGYDHVEARGAFSEEPLRILLETSQRAGLPVFLHLSRHDEGILPSREARRCLEYITGHFPLVRAVVAHFGGENFWDTLRFAEWNSNITLDMSCMDETSERVGLADPCELLKIAAGRLPAEQIIFGSDHAWGSDVASAPELAYAKDVFNTDELKCVTSTNSLALLGELLQGTFPA
jgi:predicted TIM-barrel fold metal-dependent hydrolase